MGRCSAAARAAAIFLLAICSPFAQACEDCDRAPAATKTVRLDVTAAVHTATSFVTKAWRSLKPSYQVLVAEGEDLEAPAGLSEYALHLDGGYDDSDARRRAELPAFRHRYAWELTYRDEGLELPRRSAPLLGADVTLDDSWVLGLRFELAYGWKR